jgi:hypothetical protein
VTLVEVDRRRKQSVQVILGYAQHKKTYEQSTMGATRKGSKKTARSSDSSTGVEGGIDSKRSRTDTASAKKEDTNINNPSQAVSPDNINSTSESNNAVTANNNDDDDNTGDCQNKELPTPVELSQELCKIVSDRYSRDESLRALNNLNTWALTNDSDFFKSFHTYGGIVRVLDFLKATMNDVNCKGSIRMECIESAADVISQVTFNNEIAAKIITTLLDCDGIDTLINASDEYIGGYDLPRLQVVNAVWCAFRYITHHILKNDSLISQEQAIAIFDTGIDIISQLKSVGGDIALETLEDVFYTFNSIISCDYVTKKHFQDKTFFSKCLDVFKKNDAWTCIGREDFIHNTVEFFDSCCDKNLLDESSDYEMILPLLTVFLKKYPSNNKIREHIMNMMDRSCSTINDKKVIERSGALEVLSILLASDNINDEAEKDTVRTLIGKIVA